MSDLIKLFFIYLADYNLFLMKIFLHAKSIKFMLLNVLVLFFLLRSSIPTNGAYVYNTGKQL